MDIMDIQYNEKHISHLGLPEPVVDQMENFLVVIESVSFFYIQLLFFFVTYKY